MSRITPAVQQRSHAPESEILARLEAHGVRLRPEGAFGTVWDYWVVRAFFVACAGAVTFSPGTFGLPRIAAALPAILIRRALPPADLPLPPASPSRLIASPLSPT